MPAGNPNIAKHGFKKGQSGNPKGRPKIDTAIKKIRAQASALAATNLEAVIGMAQSVLEEQLAEGNLEAAKFVIDRVIGKQASMLPESIDVKLSTIDDVMYAAQCVTEMCMLRKISIDDADKALKMLSQYASFRGLERIEELKDLIAEMNAANAKTIDGSATLPSWGRLSENTPTANKKPAE